MKKTLIISNTIEEAEEDYDSDVFDDDDDYVDSLDQEELEDAFDHFLYKLDNLVSITL